MDIAFKHCRTSMRCTSFALALLTCIACSANTKKEPAQALAATNVDDGKGKTMVMKKFSPKEQIEFSKADLAARLGLALETIRVSGATTVTWRSGAVGCPKPGVSYTDVLVPGVWILLRVDNAIYEYHGIPGGQPFYCPEEWVEGPVVGPGAD